MSTQLCTTDATALNFTAAAIRKAFKEANPTASNKDVKDHVTAQLRAGHALIPAHQNAALAEGATWAKAKPRINSKGVITGYDYALLFPSKEDASKAKQTAAEARAEKAEAENKALLALLAKHGLPVPKSEGAIIDLPANV